MNTPKLPRIVTFDGEARSGKGTIVQMTKDYLRDEHSHNVMLIDLGQVFRVLVVAVTRAGVDVDDPLAIDAFLSDENNVRSSTQLVKDVYHMTKDERDALLYTNEVSANSAKIGARPLSQSFKDDILRKWMQDAAEEGFDTVLLDGRALEETGTMLEQHKLCQFVLGLYFVCDPVVGARRTLKLADRPYDSLTDTERAEVDALVVQINARNRADQQREVQPVVPPKAAETYVLPAVPITLVTDSRPMVIINTSGDLTREEMALPVARMVATVLDT